MSDYESTATVEQVARRIIAAHSVLLTTHVKPDGDGVGIQEFWDFDDKKHTMKLIEIHHVCDLCHKIKRTDFWFFTDYGKEQLKKLGYSYEDIIKHYCRVNKCRIKDFGKNWRKAIETWKARNKQTWHQDYGDFLSQSGK